MTSPEIQILIPCHSLEDFPSDQTDIPAASLLNSFAVAFHPHLLAWTSEFPQWRRADDPPLAHRNQLILVPTVCDDWLSHGWIEEARNSGAVVVSGLSDRQEMIEAALKAVPEDHLEDDQSETDIPPFPTVNPDLVADFLSLGTCWLLVELLTRRMRQFGNLEESRFFHRAQSAARAAVANDVETTKTHLRACFEMLLEARERFYPVDCYLLDLCLAVPDADHERLLPEVRQDVPWSLMVSADDLRVILEKTPELGPELASAWEAGRICVIGSEDRETALPLLPVESALFHLEHGRSELQRITGHTPHVWGRRRYGLSALLPQLLVKFGYKAALHVVLDDGIYPDSEYTKLRWRGVDGTLIDALSRIPLAADGAASYLRFPVRMAESMDHDQVAGLILARWPSVNAPWFEDLRRSQKYAPCLGRFITLDRFFEQTELPGQLSAYKPDEYFSPHLIQHVARREQQPISRYTDHVLRRRRFDAAAWSRAMADVLSGRPVDLDLSNRTENQIESAAPTAMENSIDQASASLNEFEETGIRELSGIIMQSAKPGRGFLILNPLSFSRRVVVRLLELKAPPAVGGAIKAVDFNSAHRECTACVVEVPGCGYAWIPSSDAGTMPIVPKLPLAEKGLLRNDYFEVAINERTGGVAHVRRHNERAKRLSQQLSFRFPRERTITVGPEPEDKIKTQYAEMRCKGHEVVHSGTACGELASWGEIVDQVNNEKLAAFRQTIRVWRAMPTLEIEIELSEVKIPDGDPWNNYFTSRFAWNDITAVVTRSIYHSAQAFRGERFETSDYIEIASEDERLTIVPHALPFHRKTGDRMVDSLLVVAGENERRFRFTISFDGHYPLEAAWSATTPLLPIATEQGQPRSGATGWFFHIDARNIQIARILNAQNSLKAISPLEQFEHTTIPADPGFALRLIETEGRSKTAKLSCFRRPTFARKRDFRGETIAELIIEGDSVLVEMSAYEVVDVELRFASAT